MEINEDKPNENKQKLFIRSLLSQGGQAGSAETQRQAKNGKAL